MLKRCFNFFLMYFKSQTPGTFFHAMSLSEYESGHDEVYTYTKMLPTSFDTLIGNALLFLLLIVIDLV